LQLAIFANMYARMSSKVEKMAQSTSASAFLSAKQAARLLDLHPNTLCKWRISGAGPRYVKAGRTVKYRLSDIEIWLGNRTFSHTAEYETRTTSPMMRVQASRCDSGC